MQPSTPKPSPKPSFPKAFPFLPKPPHLAATCTPAHSTTRLQECSSQCGAQLEDKVTNTMSRQCDCCIQSFTMRWRYRLPYNAAGRHTFHNTFRRKSFGPSCSKHRKFISNRGRRKSLAFIGCQRNKTEPIRPRRTGHSSEHSNDLSTGPGHTQCSCQSSENVRWVKSEFRENFIFR